MCHFVHIYFFPEAKKIKSSFRHSDESRNPAFAEMIKRGKLCRYMNINVKNVTRSLNIWFLVRTNQQPALPAGVKK